MTAANIAKALHGRPKPGGGFLVRCPVQGHGKGRGDRNPSLSVNEGDGGRILVKCFGGCNSLDVLAQLAEMGLLPEGGRPASNSKRSPLASASRSTEPHAPSLALWREAIPVTDDTLTALYLRGRAITGPIPTSIRHHPSVTYVHSGLELPAMVSAIQDPDRRVIAVHLTFLNPAGGGKATVSKPKLFMLGARLGAGAVRLAAATDILGIAEGIEDGLSAMSLTGLPVWCALGVSRFAGIELPPTVTTVHIFAQNDKGDGPRKAVEGAAKRLAALRTVVIRRPPEMFKDWNDWHKAGAPEF